MITLHEVHEQGADEVKRAVLAFGARHRLNADGQDTAPDWKWAELHFTQLIEVIMGAATPPEPGAAAAVRRAQNAAIGFLLAVNTQADYRCPICVKRQQCPA